MPEPVGQPTRATVRWAGLELNGEREEVEAAAVWNGSRKRRSSPRGTVNPCSSLDSLLESFREERSLLIAAHG